MGWTNVVKLRAKSGTLIYCECLPQKTAIYGGRETSNLIWVDGVRWGVGPGVRIYVPENDEMTEHVDKIGDLFRAGDKANYELALTILNSITQ